MIGEEGLRMLPQQLTHQLEVGGLQWGDRAEGESEAMEADRIVLAQNIEVLPVGTASLLQQMLGVNL